MTVHFVTRHRGAREWAETHGLNVDVWVNHLDISSVNPGDIVIGTLPIHQFLDNLDNNRLD